MEHRGIHDYLSKKELNGIKKFSVGKQTPFLIVSLEKVAQNYDDLKKNLPYAKIYYAVKANPDEKVLKLLAKRGSNFDTATIYELDQLLELGVSPDRISFGNTIKKEEDIAYAYEKGIRMYATDSIVDLLKISRAAPESKVFFRLLSSGGDADWPLSKKFGVYPDTAYKLAKKAKKLGLIPYGLSFHVGSQQREIGQWDNAIAKCKYLFDALKKDGIELKMINMGGGFPANYVQPTQSLEVYADEITRFLEEDFPEGLPEIIIEPGRSIVADSGVMVSEVVMVTKKTKLDTYRWVFLDVGKFNGLIETIDESIKFPIFTEKHANSKKISDVIIAGPTCDSADIMYEDFKYTLADSLKEQDRVFILTTGAYTYSYCSVCFNGFPPLKVYIEDKF
ncbi:MAG: type III PLP-dependent enzyme [Candidatus Margulisbacteria bacterium]|nr:type III PLP-dependent enzyme [Candidatus Margulisiibacteriota bacterium]